MNESYYKLCINELNTIKDKKRILLHSCCAPCSSHVISFLSNYFDITILYYNPNISPIDEYLKRKEEQINLLKKIKTKNKINFLGRWPNWLRFVIWDHESAGSSPVLPTNSLL